MKPDAKHHSSADVADKRIDGGIKPFWASQTVWSSLAVIGSSLAAAFLAWQSGDMSAFGASLTAALGGVNAVVGRFRATALIR